MKELNRLIEILNTKFIEIEKKHFEIWKNIYLEMKEIEQAKQKNNLIEKVIEVFKTSKRGKRSLVEQEILSKYLVTIACVPKLNSSDLKKLSNEVDWVDCSGRSLIFLQGDFGACFYMIAQGSVDLYLETSKDKEMINCRKFGDFRGKSILPEDCNELGKKITTLTEGKGFGEYAILSKTHKFRGATAVASEDRSLLLVVLEDTYNQIFRKHHFRQAQMASATALLKDIPAFNWYSYSKMSQIAYNLKSQTYSGRAIIVRAGQPLTHILLIHTGSIKAVHTSYQVPSTNTITTTTTSPTRKLENINNNSNNNNSNDSQSRISSSIKQAHTPLYVRELGRGQIIGESEVLRGLDVFEMTYQASGNCEVFELSRAHFEEVLQASRLSLHESEEEGKKQSTTKLHDLHKLSLQFQSLHSPQSSPRRDQTDNKPTYFRTYINHDSPRVPLNRPTPSKPPTMTSTYEDIKNAALSREVEHFEKVERVRKVMMDMKTGASSLDEEESSGGGGGGEYELSFRTSPISFPSTISNQFSSSLVSTNGYTTKSKMSSSIMSHHTKSSPRKSKNVNSTQNILNNYEIVEDLKAILPLFSGSLTNNNNNSPSKFMTPKSPGRISPTPITTPASSIIQKTTPNIHSSTISSQNSPFTPNNISYNMSSLHSVSNNLTKEFMDPKSSPIMSINRPLILTSTIPNYCPPSNAIIEQYHKTIGRSELLNSTSLFQSGDQSSSIHLQNRSISSPNDKTYQTNFTIESPKLLPRPPRQSLDEYMVSEPKTEDELIYEQEINKHKTGTVLKNNPFETLGLPITNVFKSNTNNNNSTQNNNSIIVESINSPSQLKPQPPNTEIPSKGNYFAYNRRPVQIISQTSRIE